MSNPNPNEQQKRPKVFISYSQDGLEHSARVLALSERLRCDGVETRLDQYVPGTPHQGWPRWMMDQIDVADFVLVVCTENYYRRFRGLEKPGKGRGADWEGSLITQQIYNGKTATTKFIPVLFVPADAQFTPEPIQGLTHYNLADANGYEGLYDFLLGQAGCEPGPVGTLKRKSRRRHTPVIDPLPPQLGSKPSASIPTLPSRSPTTVKDAFEITTGFTIKASSAAVAFLWSNWEVTDLINDGFARIAKLATHCWSGRGFGAKAEMHLVHRMCAVEQGKFEYFGTGTFLGLSIRAQVVCGYRRIDNQSMAFFGEGSSAFTSRITVLKPLFSLAATRATAYGNRVGAKLAEEITRDPSVVRSRAGEEAWLLYKGYMEEEQLIRRGATGPFQYFAKSDALLINQSRSGDLEILHKKLEALEMKHSPSRDEIKINDLHSSLLVFASDPSMALVKNRTIVEHVAKMLYLRETKQLAGKRMLGEIIDLVAKESKRVPQNILALMRTVAYLGNVGGHVEDVGSARSSVEICEFGVSFTATLKVVDWFLSDYTPRKP